MSAAGVGLGLKPEDACSKAMEGKAMPVPNQVAIAAALRQIAELEQRVAALEQRLAPDPTITTGHALAMADNRPISVTLPCS